MEPPAGGHLDGGRHAQSHAADHALLDELQVCSRPCCRSCATRCATSALPQWPSPSSRRPTSRRPSATTPPHATPTSHLELPSRRLPLAALSTSSARRSPTSQEQEPPRHLSACASSTRRPRASRARALGQGQVPLSSCHIHLAERRQALRQREPPTQAARLQPVCALGSSSYIRPKRYSTERSRCI